MCLATTYNHVHRAKQMVLCQATDVAWARCKMTQPAQVAYHPQEPKANKTQTAGTSKPIPAHTTLHGQMHRSLSPDRHLMTRHPINQPASKFTIPHSPFLTCASSNISLPETSYLPTQNTLCQMDHTHRPAPPQQLTSNELHCTHSAT